MDCSIDDMLSSAAAECHDRIAIVDGNNACSFAELDRQVSRFADELRERGISRGDRVGIHTHKSIGQVVAILAAARAKAVFVVISSKLKADQVNFICKDGQLRLLIAEEAGQRQLADAGCARQTVECSVAVGPVEVALLGGEQSSTGMKSRASHVDRGSPTIRSDLACLMYTSGSTGKPKGVMVTHGNMLAGAESVTSYLSLNSEDRIAGLLPFSFDYGLNQLLCALKTRCCLVLTHTTFPQEIARTMQGQSITVCAGIPPIWAQMFHNVRGVEKVAPFSSVRILTNSGGKVSVQTVRDIERAFPNAKIFLMYGLTEAFRSTYLPPEQLHVRPGSIGKAVPNAEVFLVTDDKRPAQPGEVGEIVHRGDTVAVGYWNRPEDTARVFRLHPFTNRGNALRDYVVYSGDYAVQDEEGYLYYLGRRDQQIKVSGMRVSPEEIETVIAEIEGVSECVVVGTAGDDSGDRIVAFVLARGPVNEATILSQCSRKLPRHMVPREVRLLESFPRLENGKTDRVALRNSLRDREELRDT